MGTIPNQAIATGQSATLDVSAYFRDPDGGALTFTVASSADGVVSVSLSGTTLTMVGVASGTATVTVTARDPDGLTAAQGFEVTVETPNRAPEAVGAIAAQTLAAGSSETVDVSSYFRDPDGDALTYAASSSNAAVATAAVSGAEVAISAVASGTATVTVTARDPDGLTAAQGFEVTVETPNRAPEAVGAIAAQTLAAGSSETVDVSSYFRDPDGDALTYAASSSNAAVATAAVSGAEVAISAVASGTATVTVTARDPDGLTAAQGFEVTVETPNRAPEAVGAIAAQTLAAGSSETVDVSSYFRDPDGDALTYAASSSNAAVATAAVSGAEVAISAVASGTATVTVTARDPDGLTAAQGFEVTVETPNRAPEAVGAIAAQTLAAGSSETVDVSSYFRDPDGDALTYTASSSNAAVATAAVSGAEVAISAVASGTATVTVTARDPDGLTAAQGFQVTVPTTPPPPPGISVDLRIEPSQSEYDAFRVLVDPTFFADRFDLQVFVITGDDAATWEFANDQPITAGEGRAEIEDLNSSASPQPLEDITRARVVYEESFSETHVLLCTILGGRTPQRVEATCSPAPPPPPPTPPFDGTVDLRIEPSQSEFDAFRVLADPTFFADRFDLEVFVITGDDAATWEFANDQPITAGEGRVELEDLNSSASPQPLEDITRARVVYAESFSETHVLLCTILAGRTSQRVEATCSPAPPPPPPTPPFDGTVDLRIEPSQSEFDAFRVLADPTFFADRFDLEVFVVTGEDAASWEFVNDQPITAGEGRVELEDLNSSASPQPLEDITRARVVYAESFTETHVLLCTILAGRTSQRLEATCATP